MRGAPGLPRRVARAVRALAAALALAVLAAAALAQPAPPSAPEPPLDIRADNMTGSHGPEGDILLLNGNLRFVRGRAVLTADAGRYLRGQGLLFLDGRVKMVDSTTTIDCDHASFDENTDVLQVDGNVVIHDRDAVLHAPSGTYDRRAARAELVGHVSGRDREQRLESDRAIYWRDSSLVQARGHVRGFDDTNKLELDADSVDFDRRTREALAHGQPVLQLRDDHDRVTRLYSRLMHLNTESRVAEAIDSVRVVSDTLQARADYALFDDKANRGWLLGKPRAWDDQTTVNGDTLEFWSDKRVLRRVVVRGNAVMDYHGSHPNTMGERSRLTGSRVDAFITNQNIDSLVAVGAARNDYGAPTRAGKTQETNLALGDTITVFFKDRKIDRARVVGQAKGEFHPAVDVGDTTAAKREQVAYDAVRIEYVVPKSRIVLDQGAHLTYGELELRSRRVEYDVGAQTLVAEGKPELHDRGDEVSGGLMTYDLDSRVGNIYSAQTAYEKGLYRGERIRKANENELDVLGGSYTTCNLEQPHYHFASRWMKIYLKDKLVAKPVVFYLKNVPIFALPFYVFPIKPGRHSGFLFPQFEFGFSNQAGQFVRNAGYYWAPNDYMDLTASGDYYQAEPSWVTRLDGVYKLLYVLDGDFHTTFARNEATRHDDWDFTGEHSQELSPRTRLAARGSFVSSRDYNSSNLYGRSLAQRLNRFLTSNLAVSHAADWASFNAYIDRRQDLDADINFQSLNPALGTVGPTNLSETRPNLSVSFPSRTLGSLSAIKGTKLEGWTRNLTASLSARYLEPHERHGVVTGYNHFTTDSLSDSIATLTQVSTTRRGFGADGSLSDTRRAFGWLNVGTGVNASSVVFDHDALGHKLAGATVWSGRLTTSSTFYGTFAPKLGPLIGLRHVVTPSVFFTYAPEFRSLEYTTPSGLPANRFSDFPGLGVAGNRASSMSFSLDQRLQAKVKHGTEVTRMENLLSFTTSGSYDFLWRQNHAAHGLSVLSSSVNLQPPGLMSAGVAWTTDPYQGRPVRNMSGNVGVNLGSRAGRSGTPELPLEQQTPTGEEPDSFRDVWSLGLAYSYTGGYANLYGPLNWSDRQSANLVTHYQFSPGWTADWSSSYDITYHFMTTQRFSVTRDLHCWVASFSRTFALGGEAEYYFRIAIKDQKELYLERGTRLGSIGGIQ